MARQTLTSSATSESNPGRFAFSFMTWIFPGSYDSSRRGVYPRCNDGAVLWTAMNRGPIGILSCFPLAELMRVWRGETWQRLSPPNSNEFGYAEAETRSAVAVFAQLFDLFPLAEALQGARLYPRFNDVALLSTAMNHGPFGILLCFA
jgi:hypothetical protein